MKLSIKLFLFINIVFLNQSFAQSIEEHIFKQKLTLPKSNSNAQTALIIAKSFIGQPYKAGTLDANSTEKLVCNLKDFDCWTFVENVTAITLMKNEDKPSFEKFNNQLKYLRYRGGKLNGYGSRLHYFKEWMIQAEEYNIAQEMTPIIGGINAKKAINFMTNHRALYPKLSDQKAFSEVEAAQKHINEFEFYYIPKNKVAKIENEIQDGDIIGITSMVEGLDFNHEGFAIKQNGKVHLLHASHEQMKVIISNETLVDYLARIKKHSGITVLRLL